MIRFSRTLSRRQQGFTLIEAAIVLAIIGLVAGGIWVAASSVYENLRTSRASEELLFIVQQTRSLHATQGTFTAATDELASAKVFPADMLSSSTDTTPENPWRGSVEVFANGTSTGFWVVFNGLPKSSCIDLAVRNTGQGRDTGLVGVNLSSSAQSSAPSGTGTAPPLTITQATSGCSASTSVNSAAFLFNLKG